MFLLLAAVLGSQPYQAAKVSIAYVDCASRPTNAVSAAVFDVTTGRQVNAAVRDSVEGRIHHFSFEVRSGYYDVVLARQRCEGSTLRVAVLHNRDVSVSSYGSGTVHIDEGGSALAGSLPDDSLQPILHCTKSGGAQEDYVAVVQDHAYYFNFVDAPANCDLGIRFPNQHAPDIWLSHDISVDLKRTMRFQTVDISWQMIEQALRE